MRFPLDDEQRKKVQGMDIEPLAKLAFLYLKCKHGSDTSGPNSVCSVAQISSEIFPRTESSPYAEQSGYIRLFEAIALLERRGLVVIDIRHLAMRHEDYNTAFLTSIGRKSEFHAGVLLLVDKPEEIVREVEEAVGALDPIVRQYYLESLRAFQAELYISSVIDLGATSERAIHWLAESLETYSPKYQAKIKTRREGHILRLTEYLSNTVIPDIVGHDKKFEAELKDRLDGLGKLYRENRNEAGHPKAVDQSWSREDQEILLLQFRKYITTICKAIGML